MTSATPTGYGPRHRGLMFDGEESRPKYELWEIKLLGYMRLRKLSFCFSVSASYCIPQCVRLIAGVSTHYVVY